jgi:hypothetical protein
MATDGEPKLSNLAPAVEDAVLECVLAAFTNGNSDQAQPNPRGTGQKSADLVELALKLPARLEQLVLAMFPDGPRVETEFYGQLERIGHWQHSTPS